MPETIAEKEARWTNMAEEEIAKWKQEAREANSSGSSTASRPKKKKKKGRKPAPEPEPEPEPEPSRSSRRRQSLDDVINHFLALPVDRAIAAREALGLSNEYVESVIDGRSWAQGKKKPKGKRKNNPKGKTVKAKAKELIRTRRKKKKKKK